MWDNETQMTWIKATTRLKRLTLELYMFSQNFWRESGGIGCRV